MRKDDCVNRVDKLVLYSGRTAMALLCVLMTDCCIFGAGRVISFGPVSFRMLVLGLLLISSVPALLTQFHTLIRNKYIWVVLLFALWLVVSAIIGLINNHRRELIMTDLKGFAYFAILPVCCCIIQNRSRIYLLMKCMMYASAFLALFTCVLLFLYVWFPDFFFVMNRFFSPMQVAAISLISSKIPRMFFKSVLYLLCGCAFSVYFQVTSSSKKIYPQYLAITGLCLFALLMSYTRSVYLAALIAAGGCIAFLVAFGNRTLHTKLFLQIGTGVVAFLVIVGLFSVTANTNYFSYALKRSLPIETNEPSIPINPSSDSSGGPSRPSEDQMKDNYLQLTLQSDELRQKTMEQLWLNINRSPLIGLGLGAEIPIRPDGLNEYFYMDLWSKGGFVGLSLYLMPLVLMIVYLVRSFHKPQVDKLLLGIWLSVLLGFMSFSLFNPYMNAALGILYYCCTIGVFQCEEKNYYVKPEPV